MARVLRRDNISTKPAFSFQDLDRQAQATLEGAREQARQIVVQSEQQARQRAARLEEEGRRHGVEEGRRQGFEQAHREATEAALREARENLDHLGQALTKALNAIDEDKRRLLATAERGLLELALAVARRVCKHDAGATSATAIANARTLLALVKHQEDLELHLNPAECEALRGGLSDLCDAAGRLQHVEIVADPAVERGGCVLHTRDGTIDAGLEAQLDRVAAALVGGG